MALSMEKAVGISRKNIETTIENSRSEDIEKEAASLSESSEHINSSQNPDEQQDHPLSRTTSRKSVVENTLSRLASHLTTRSIRDPGPPPDGGFTAWLQCFLCWLVVLNTWGFVLSFGAFQTYYSSTLNMDPSTVSWIGSVQAWLMFFLGAFSGRALDAGLFRPTIIIGILFQLIGMFMMSLSTKYWQLFITQGVLIGIGGGIFFCPAMGLLSTYFSKHRGIAVGLATTGNSTGGMIFPVLVQQLLPKIGFAWTVRVLGFVNLVSLFLVIAFMKPRLPPRKSGPIIEWSALKDIPYVLFVLGVFLLICAIYWVFYYIGSFGQDVIGLSYTQSVNLIIILNGVGIPARIIPGFLVVRFGIMNVFLPLCLINVVIIFCWLGVKDIASFYTFTVFAGALAASWQGMFPTCIANLSNDITKTGTRLGMAFSVISFAALIGGPIGGALLGTDHGSYMPAQVWAALMMVCGLSLTVGTRVVKWGWDWRTKC